VISWRRCGLFGAVLHQCEVCR